ncbi:MAG: LytTR family transcriptional regulator DNA-binding domain-containing protein [Lachnospiraceae bacterium]|nr:LytTR family transcriptional regulator DNA-binding domain-containing protein [Lachnospiraceae bacterium]MBP5183691.1 LytTR family transcriptional regulator DNA-binding domain-containing protein [Lachnospiraceae bacterium]
MKIDIQKIAGGEESIVIRYIEPNPVVERVVELLSNKERKLWGKTSEGNECISLDDVLFLESVDDRVFAYTKEKVLQIDGSLNSFTADICDECFFRCSKSMVININKVVSLKSLSSNRIDATMDGGEHIMISRRYASEFRRLLKGDR